MRSLGKRVARLEPRKQSGFHVVEMQEGETQEQAIERYGQPIDESDLVVLLNMYLN